MLDSQQQLEELRRFNVPNLVNGLDFDPSGTWIAVATSESDIGVYSTAGEPARRLTSHMSSVGSVRWVDNRHLASAGYDGQVIIRSPWDEATDGVLFSLPNWAAGTRVGSTPCLDDRPARRGLRASSSSGSTLVNA
jgi:WD40 repeat protein